MNIEFALEYIPRRMQELGVNNSYLIKFRHLVIPANERYIVDGADQFYLLVYADSEITVSSEFGNYDLQDIGINEQQYEHQGKISITNLSYSVQHIKFIQIIPIHQ